MKNITLEDKRVRLTPLSLENWDSLIKVASQPGLVAFSPSVIEHPDDLRAYVHKALEQEREKQCIPYIIFDKKQLAVAGCTRYMQINWQNKVLHIGSTWIGREFQGTGLNTHVKILMIDHAFNQLGFEKVEFRIDERNGRSRRAVEKLGAVLEGILRKDVYLPDGFKRNTCCYGILPEEWSEKRLQLLSSLA